MTISGTPKISGLAILDLTAEIRTTGTKLTCKAGWVDTVKGGTRGWVQGEGAIWSPETVSRLIALVDSMEQDMGALHFDSVISSGTTERQPVEVGGLAEHLEEANQA
jgi:hypothetical protein